MPFTTPLLSTTIPVIVYCPSIYFSFNKKKEYIIYIFTLKCNMLKWKSNEKKMDEGNYYKMQHFFSNAQTCYENKKENLDE